MSPLRSEPDIQQILVKESANDPKRTLRSEVRKLTVKDRAVYQDRRRNFLLAMMPNVVIIRFGE